MKKVLAILIAVLMLSALCVPALAASDINADEQRVIDLLSTAVEGKNDTQLSIKVSDVNQAKNFFMKDEIDLSKADADTMIANIKTCMDIVTKAGLTTEDLTAIGAENADKLLAAGNAAGAPVGVTISYDLPAKKVNFIYEGKTIATLDPTIKVTGPDYTMLFVVLGAAVLAVAGLAVMVKKTACAK